jgi:hypothetical protein
MIIELSIIATYILNQGLWEALREVLQNGLDGKDSGYPLSVEHENGWLRVTNRGVTLDHSALLLGKSTKRDNDLLRGFHGEGFKLAMLILTRLGIKMYVLNGSEKWTPVLAESKTFSGETVLKVKIRKLRGGGSNDLVVYVKIKKSQWKQYADRFLPLLSPVQIGKTWSSSSLGSVLLDPAYRGKIYCKGIYVQDDPERKVGYDFTQLKLDRDRQAVNSWDVNREAARLWNDIHSGMVGNPELVGAIYDTAASGCTDMNGLQYEASTVLLKKVQERFIAMNGSKARPVTCEAEAVKLEHYGLRGVVVTRALHSLLCDGAAFGSMEHQIEEALLSNGHYVTEDPGLVQRLNWQRALRLLDAAGVASTSYLDRCKIYCWDAEEAPRGMYSSEEIKVNVRQLASWSETLGTLIHEVAHRADRDGTVNHREAMAKAWKQVVQCLADHGGLSWLDEV